MMSKDAPQEQSSGHAIMNKFQAMAEAAGWKCITDVTLGMEFRRVHTPDQESGSYGTYSRGEKAWEELCKHDKLVPA